MPATDAPARPSPWRDLKEGLAYVWNTPLLRAVMCISPRDKRLYLRRADHPRRPGLDQQNDYDIIWRGKQVGRIWRYEYPNHPWTGLGPWHWRRCNERGRDAEGHGPTLEAVMADFRRAWDAVQKRGAANEC